MQVEVGPQHRWLQQLVGEWSVQGESEGPDGAHAAVGTEVVTPLGELWVVCRGEVAMACGGPTQSMMTLGYDPAAGHFVGTWHGSMMTYQWLYRGSLDEAERVLTLESEGPSFDGDGTALYRDVIEILTPDHRTLTGQVQAADGSWHVFMKTHYHRKG